MSKILMSHGFSLPVKCVFDEDGIPFQIDDSFGDLLIDGESTCDETNYELVAHAINTHDYHVNRISDLERQLKAEREINDRLRVVETERAVRNDELYEALGKLLDVAVVETKGDLEVYDEAKKTYSKTRGDYDDSH